MQNKARNILQLKIQIRACIPYRDGSQPTILHSDHATVGPHGCFEIMLKKTGMIMLMLMIKMIMIMLKMTVMIMLKMAGKNMI